MGTQNTSGASPILQLTIRLLQSIEDIEKEDAVNRAPQLNKRIPAIEVCPRAIVATRSDGANDQRISWADLWQQMQDSMLAGISAENVMAISGIVMMGAETHALPDKSASFIRNELRQVFGENNVLSCIGGYMGPSVFCHFLVYPLDGRILTPTRWIDPYSKQLKRDYHEQILLDLSNFLGVNYQAQVSSISNGHTQFLDTFPPVYDRIEDTHEQYYQTILPESQMTTDQTKDQLQAATNNTIKAFTTGVERANFIKLTSGDIRLDQFLDEARRYVKRNFPGTTDRDLDIIIHSVQQATAGFYVLEPLINDPKISDIKTVAPNKIRVKVQGARKTSNLTFIDTEDYMRFLEGLQLRYGLDPDQDIYKWTDKYVNPNYILRINLTMTGINSDFPVMHIRKIPKTKYSLNQLIELGMMDQQTANYLLWAARNASGIVFCGKGSSGKTTLMNSLLEYTPSDASGLCIQESEELFSAKSEMTFEHITDHYDLQALARNGLLTDIDYFIIGEIKGDEALDFIVAATTGNKAWCSVHGSSASGGIDRLADYIMKAQRSKYDRPQALSMLANLQVVVFMKQFKVAEIREITGWDPVSKELTYRTVLKKKDLIDKTTPVDSAS